MRAGVVARAVSAPADARARRRARDDARARGGARATSEPTPASSTTNAKSERRARERAKREEEMEALSRRQDAARVVSRVVKTGGAPASGTATSTNGGDGDDGKRNALAGVTGRAPAMTPEIVEEEVERERVAFANEVALMFVAGAILGPLLDHQHSRFDVLHYATPLQIHFDALFAPLWNSPFGPIMNFIAPEPVKDLFRIMFVNENGVLETGWWVPPLFGAAAIVIGLGHTSLDEFRIRSSVKRAREIEIRKGLQGTEQIVSRTSELIENAKGKPALGWQPSWVSVNLCISVFAFQYLVSGILASPQSPFVDGFLPYHLIDIFLCVWAVTTWYFFDNSAQGLFMASLTAVCGPVAEIVLINYGHLYSYSHPDILGIPTWIPWVYFCGGPAVGNLSRQVRNTLRRQSGLPGPTTRVVSYEKRKWASARASASISNSGTLDAAAYAALDREKRVVNKNFKEIPKGRFTILTDGPMDIQTLAKKRQEEEELTRALQSARGGTQKRRRAVRRYVARQNDLKSGRKSVRERIVRLLVRRKPDDVALLTTEEDKASRLSKIQQEIMRVEATLDEVERMKQLKKRLETIKMNIEEAAPPLMPKLRRFKSRLDDAVPAPWKPTYEALEDAIGDSIVPLVRDNTPESVRKAMKGSFETEELRRQHIARMNAELIEIQAELTKNIQARATKRDAAP